MPLDTTAQTQAPHPLQDYTMESCSKCSRIKMTISHLQVRGSAQQGASATPTNDIFEDHDTGWVWWVLNPIPGTNPSPSPLFAGRGVGKPGIDHSPLSCLPARIPCHTILWFHPPAQHPAPAAPHVPTNGITQQTQMYKELTKSTQLCCLATACGAQPGDLPLAASA